MKLPVTLASPEVDFNGITPASSPASSPSKLITSDGHSLLVTVKGGGAVGSDKESQLPPITTRVNGLGRQLFAAAAANMSSAALGTVLSWTSTALPDLRKTTKFSFTEGQENWIGPLALLGAVLACPIAGYLIEKAGRRATLLYLNLPFFLGYLLIGFAQNIEMIYLGRILTGFCIGCFSSAAPLFVVEFSHPKIRGMLTAGFDVMITVGILYIFIIGTFVSWEIQAFACGLIAVVCHVLLSFVPESPIYLVQKGRFVEAQRALEWFGGYDRSSAEENGDGGGCLQQEMFEQQLIDLKKSIDESRSSNSSSSMNLKTLLLDPCVLKPLAISVALMFFQEMCGIDAVMFYTVDIFNSAGTSMNENLATNIVGAIQVLATITAALVVDRCGRRFLLIVSELFMTLSLGGLGFYFFMQAKQEQEHSGGGGDSPSSSFSLSWLPLTSLMIFVVAFSIGFGPVPWMMVGELAPSQAKGIVSGIATISHWLLGFIVTLVFKDIIGAIGEAGCYWFFGSFCVLGTIFVCFFVPETKGKTLDEIQQHFSGGGGGAGPGAAGATRKVKGEEGKDMEGGYSQKVQAQSHNKNSCDSIVVVTSELKGQHQVVRL